MNILSLIESQLSPQTISQIGNAVGESPEGTKSALGMAFPALLGSLFGKASSSPSGVTDVFNMIKQGPGQGQSGWSDSVGSVTNAVTGGPQQNASRSFLGSLLGSKLGPVADLIAGKSGIRGSSASSLLGMAAPLLMGTLSKQISSQGLGAAGLGRLLSAQAPFLKNAIPSELANTLGIGNILASAPKEEIPAAPGVREEEAAYQDKELDSREPSRTGGSLLKWAVVPVLLALAVWFMANRSGRERGGTSDVPAPALTGTGHRTPDFSNLSVTPGGFADNLAKTISSGNWSRTLDLQGFTTDTAGTLSDSSKASVQELSQVLSAAPNVKIRITGSGDTDEAGLSQANSIKNALVSAGISESRISTSGRMGSGVPTLNLMR